MICSKCGKPVYADDDFCTYCGARKMETEARSPAVSTRVTVYKVVLVIASVVAALAVVGLIMWYTGYEKVVDDFFKAYETSDAQLMSRVQARCWSDYTDDRVYEGRSMELIESDLESAAGIWERYYGEDIKIEYEILETRRASSSELAELETDILGRYSFEEYSRSEYGITDAYVVEVSYSVVGDEGRRDYEYPMELLLIKEGGSWRVMYYGVVRSSFYSS